MKSDLGSFKTHFANNLRKLREGLGYTKAHLADIFKVSPATIHNWESDQHPQLPNAYYVARLSDEFEVSSEELLGTTSSPRRVGYGLKWSIITTPTSKEIQKGIEIFDLIMSGDWTKNRHRQRRPSKMGQREESPVFNAIKTIRLLRAAFLSQSIQLTDVDRDHGLEAKLTEMYGNSTSLFVVSKVMLPSDNVIDSVIRAEAIGFLTANCQEVRDSLDGIDCVGLSGGTPLSRFVDLLHPESEHLNGIEWLSILSTDNEYIIPKGISANSLVARLLYRQSSRGALMPFVNTTRRKYLTTEDPAVLDGTEKSELERAKQLLLDCKRIQAVFLTVGASETNFDDLISLRGTSRIVEAYNHLGDDEKQNCCGDILLRLIDENGDRVGSNSIIHGKSVYDFNEEFVFSISHDDLKAIASQGRVWVLAERPDKARVVKAALKSGLANCAVVDRTIAERLLH